MTAFTQKTFSVGSTDAESQKKYASNWDRVFGKRDGSDDDKQKEAKSTQSEKKEGI